LLVLALNDRIGKLLEVLPCDRFGLTAVGGDVGEQPTLTLVGDGSADNVVDGGYSFTCTCAGGRLNTPTVGSCREKA
jgi:hypothetical protein